MSGRYQIMEKIGQGGTGIVYKAYDYNLRKYVVVKKIKDYFVGTLNNRLEVDILKRLHHPYLPQVYDFLVIGQQVFTVMDFVKGRELTWYASQGYVIGDKQIRKWAEQLAEVLSYLHRQVPAIIHGDIKPSNIMVTDQQDICLIDFNISLGDGDLSLIYGISESYAAPEQIQKMRLAEAGQVHQMIHLDGRTDIYSAAKSLYVQMQYGKLRGVEYPAALWEIMEKAMSARPEERYQSADKMLYALQNIEKADKDYRKYSMCSFLVHCGYALCMVAAICMIVLGLRMNEREEYVQAQNLLAEYARGEEADLMVEQGLAVLNMEGFARVEEGDPLEAALIFHTVGDGYYLQQDYGEAADYYELAIDRLEEADRSGEERPDQETFDQYYMDFGVSLAREGKTQEAYDMAEQAETAGVSEDCRSLIRGEAVISQGELEEGLMILTELCETSEDEKVRVQVYLLMSDIYEQEGERTKAVRCMELAQETEKSDAILRRLGSLYYQTGNLEKAVACFETLIQQYEPTYADCINYAVCCESDGDFGSGQEILRKMCERYPDRYEAYMHLAYSSYRLGRDSTARAYYQQAQEVYDGTGDAMMEELEHRYAGEKEEGAEE